MKWLVHAAAAFYGDGGFGLSGGSSEDRAPSWLGLPCRILPRRAGWSVWGLFLPPCSAVHPPPRSLAPSRSGGTALLPEGAVRGVGRELCSPLPSCLPFQGLGMCLRPGAPARVGDAD